MYTLCIFKIFHNLKAYMCGRFEERFKKSLSKILSLKKWQPAIIKVSVFLKRKTLGPNELWFCNWQTFISLPNRV